MRGVAVVLATLGCCAATAFSETDPPSTTPRHSSVGNAQGPAPGVGRTVRKLAVSAGCTVASFKSAGINHGSLATKYRYPQTPPVSGTHYPRWAEWGIYDQPVPPQYLLHNLEHGGVVVHIAAAIPAELREFYDAEPGYLIFVPPASARLAPPAAGTSTFPGAGLVLTSWQRRMVCPTWSPDVLRAVRAYVRRYRGTGWESIPPYQPSGKRPKNVPAPVVMSPDPAR
jgi:hypothetical protein